MKKSLRLIRCASILCASIATVSQAALVWDADGLLNGTTGGSGNWNQTDPLWSANGSLGAWNGTETAVFDGTAGTVSLTQALTASGLQFNVDGYKLQGSGLTLGNNAMIGTNFAATGAATINVALGGTNLIFNSLGVDSTLPNLGQGRVLLSVNPTNNGTTTVNGGVLELGAGVTMNTGSGIVINGSGLLHPRASAGTAADYPFHRLRLGMLQIDGSGDIFGSQTVTLNGGTLLRASSTPGNDAATIQNLALNSGESILAASSNTATAGDTLAITNLTRASAATVQFRSQYGTLGANGDNGKISLGTLNGVAVTNTNGMLGGWAYANDVAAATQGTSFSASFAAWDDSLGSVRAVVADKSTAAGGVLTNQTFTTALGTENWLVSSTSTITTDLTVNSLIEQNDIVINGGATLKIASGGLIMRTNNFWLQSADATGKITSLESDGNLFLNTASLVDTLSDMRLRVRLVDNGATSVRLVKTGNGKVAIGQYNSGASTANSYSGGTIIEAGIVLGATVDAFGTGAVTVLPGGQAFLGAAGTYANQFTLSGPGAVENTGVLGAIRFSNGSVIGGDVTLTGTARLTPFSNTETGTINGVISGAFGVEKTGAGILVLGGASPNTYTGITEISAGTVRVGKTGAFGPVDGGPVNVRGGALDLNSFDLGTKIVDLQGAGISAAGAVVNSGAAANQGLQKVSLSANASIGGTNRWDVRGTGATVTLNGFTLTKTGANVIGLAQATVSAGNIVVGQGQLAFEAGTSVLAATGASVQVNAGASLLVHDFGTPVTLTREVKLNGGELASNVAGASGNSTIGAPITLMAASNVNVGDDSTTMRLTGSIGGTAALTKIGSGTLQVDGGVSGLPAFAVTAGTLLLNGTVAAATPLNVTGGKLILGSAGAIAEGGTATFNGGVLDQTAQALTVTGNRTLAVGRTGTPANDVLGNLTIGAGAFLNVGATGSAQTATFANGLTLSGSTVRFDLGNTTTPGGGVNDLVNVAGTLDVSGGNVALAFNALGGPLATGSYTLFTAGTLNGTLANFVAPVSETRQLLSLAIAGNSVLLNASGSSKTITWTGSAGKAWDLKTTASWNDGTAADVFYNQDTVNLGETGAGSIALVGALRPAATNISANADYTFTGAGSLGGVLTKQGSGTLVLANSGVNAISSATIDGGVLQIGNGTLGSFGTGAVTNNGVVVLRLPDGSAMAGVISGTGSLTKADSGVVTLNAANSYTGPTSVTGGLVSVPALANGGASSGLGASANAAANLTLDGGGLRYTGGAVSTDRLFTIGAGGATLEAAGTGVLSLTNTGSLAIAGDGDRTLTLSGTNTGNNQINAGISNPLTTGVTALVKQGAGTWVLNGNNPFTGGVTVNGGVLATDGSQQNNRLSAANSVTINNTGVFEVRGVNALPATGLPITVNAGGIFRVVTGGSAATGAAGQSHNHFNTIALNGATIQLTYSGGGSAYDGESFQLDGDITVGGTAPSLITSTLGTTQQGIGLGGVRTFTVNDVTNSPATDLTVSAELENRDAGGPAGGFIKAGAGTMLLTQQNTFGGALTVAGGTLAVDSAGGTNLLRANAGVTVQTGATFEIRGVNALPTGASAVDFTLQGGALSVVSGGSALSPANSHAHVRNITMNGGAVLLSYSGTFAAFDEESFQLNGNVTVGGTTASTIGIVPGTSTTQQGVSLNGNRTFTVNDVVAGSDLIVTAQLENSSSTPNDDGVTKTGVGTMEIAAVSDYSGPTVVSAGSLLVSGSLTGSSNISVAGGATLGGSGKITPTGTGSIAFSAGATLEPGTNGVGTLTVDGGGSTAVGLLSLLTDAKLSFELGSGSAIDSVTLVNGAASDIIFADNIITISGTPAALSYKLFHADVANAYSGLFFENGVDGKILAGLYLDAAFTTANPQASLTMVGNDIMLSIPEPSSALVLLSGLAMLCRRRVRRPGMR